MAATFIDIQNATVGTLTCEDGKWREKLGEGFWFTVCFVLFLILGPFAAPIVLCFMFSNNTLNCEMQEPESGNESARW